MSNSHDNDIPKPAESGPLDLPEYPEIDIQVAKKLGWTDKDFALLDRYNLPAYSTRIDHAWLVVEFIRETISKYVWVDSYQHKWIVQILDAEKGQTRLATGRGETAPLAVCRAFLNLKLEVGKE
jgi:hypothetical protein